jgi:hypothetical protein
MAALASPWRQQHRSQQYYEHYHKTNPTPVNNERNWRLAGLSQTSFNLHDLTRSRYSDRTQFSKNEPKSDYFSSIRTNQIRSQLKANHKTNPNQIVKAILWALTQQSTILAMNRPGSTWLPLASHDVMTIQAILWDNQSHSVNPWYP